MSLDESSVLMDRALVTMCQDLPESLGLYNTDKDQLSLTALRAVPLLEQMRPGTRKLALITDWMRAFEPTADQPPSAEITVASLQATLEQERAKQRDEEMQDRAKRDEQQQQQKETRKCEEKKRRRGRTRRVEVESDDESESQSSDASSSSSSSETSLSSDAVSTDCGKKRIKTSRTLPPLETVLTSDEDDEPNEMFDTDDPDVYEVETILRKKKGETYGEQDLYEVKWEGYDETTWEPASNISKDLIDEFEGQPVREDVYTVEEIIDRRRKRDAKTRLKTHQYKVKWVGYDDLTWEPAENLPHNLRRKFDQKYESRKRR